MKARPLQALLLLVAVPLVLGAVIAPQAYAHLLPLLQRAFPAVDSFADADFPRVMDRCVVGVVLVVLVPAFRMSGMLPRLRTALRLGGGRAGLLAASVGIGLASMGGAYVLGWLLGGYRTSDDVMSPAHLAGRGALFLAGSVFVGLFEEIFFRGFLFGVLRTRLGFWPAAVAGSVFFMSLHFLHPPLPDDFDGTRWSAGFTALAHVAGGFDVARDAAFALTLFLMGLTLCRLYERDGHLWRMIGLHGGWVFAMQFGAFAFDRNWAILRGLLGPSDYVAQGPVAVPITAAFLVWALVRAPGAGAPEGASR